MSAARNDATARFGCGALIGIVIVGGTLLGRGLYDFLGPQLERPLFAWTFGLGLPIGLGLLSVSGGWGLSQKLASWLLKL